MLKQQILQRYRELLPELQTNGAAIHRRLVLLLQESGIDVHNVSFRVKSEDSVKSKVSRPDRIYQTVDDLSDLVGLRVVTYFEDSIEAVAHVVETHFQVDRERSVDKRLHQDPSSFDYRSLHYVCQSSDTNLTFEIQIRTILQHAWAEIEHDLGYKFPEAVPLPIKRRFSRLAGLLEIADAEFVELRKTMESYESAVKHKPGEGQGLDLPLLVSIVESPGVRRRDQRLAETLGKPLSDRIFYPDYLIRLLRAAGLNRAQDIYQRVNESEADPVDFMRQYFAFTNATWGFSGEDFDTLFLGYSLFLQAHREALHKARASGLELESLSAFFQNLDYPDDEREARRVAGIFLEQFKGWT
jgi:putative GTP pyrophosphokinase